jgi:hypothetical protein
MPKRRRGELPRKKPPSERPHRARPAPPPLPPPIVAEQLTPEAQAVYAQWLAAFAQWRTDDAQWLTEENHICPQANCGRRMLTIKTEITSKGRVITLRCPGCGYTKKLEIQPAW